jgi:hypothetical protein
METLLALHRQHELMIRVLRQPEDAALGVGAPSPGPPARTATYSSKEELLKTFHSGKSSSSPAAGAAGAKCKRVGT